MKCKPDLSAARFLLDWTKDSRGLCRICGVADPTPSPLSCPTGCDLDDAYENWRDEQIYLARQDSPAPRLALIAAQDIKPQTIQWLMRGYLPFGKLTGIDGQPGVGKSTLIIDLIARASRGAPMPDGSLLDEPIDCVIIGSEDGIADTVVARLIAADADLSRVFFPTSELDDGNLVTLPDEIDVLRRYVEERNVRWIHLDAIMGSMSGKTNAYSDHEVRRALGPLVALADQYGVLVTFIRHLRKSGGTQAINAGGGSIAFGALSRSMLIAGYDPTDNSEATGDRRRILAVTKASLAKPPSSLLYRIVGLENGSSCIEWLGVSPVSADDVSQSVNAQLSGDDAAEHNEMEEWLLEVLRDRDRTRKEIISAAREEGYAIRTVDRISKKMGIYKTRRGFGGGSTWSLMRIDRAIDVNAPPPDLADENDANGADENLRDKSGARPDNESGEEFFFDDAA